MAEKKTTKKKTTKKKTKKKVAKKTETKVEPTPESVDVLNVKFNSEFLKEILIIKDYFGLPDETAVLFRGLALLKEISRRKDLGYELCFVETKTSKIVAVDFGEAKDAGGS